MIDYFADRNPAGCRPGLHIYAGDGLCNEQVNFPGSFWR